MNKGDNIVFALIISKKGRCDFVETWNILFFKQHLENVFENKFLLYLKKKLNFLLRSTRKIFLKLNYKKKFACTENMYLFITEDYIIFLEHYLVLGLC